MTSGPSEHGSRLREEYAELSHRHAREGRLRLAQLAAWASDVHLLEALLWQHGLAEAPDPAAALASIGESVAASVEQAAARLPEDARLTAAEVLELARGAMVATFDESVHALLTDGFGTVAHLDECRPQDADAEPGAAARLGGRTAPELVDELRTAAADCMTMAELLAADGEAAAAARLARQSDAAAFEAYLVDAAVRSGDDTLATVDLRWSLVADGDRPHDRFADVVGSAEQEALLGELQPPVAP